MMFKCLWLIDSYGYAISGFIMLFCNTPVFIAIIGDKKNEVYILAYLLYACHKNYKLHCISVYIKSS